MAEQLKPLVIANKTSKLEIEKSIFGYEIIIEGKNMAAKGYFDKTDMRALRDYLIVSLLKD